MTISLRERLTTRPLRIAVALATVVALVSAAFMLSRLPSPRQAATSAPNAVASPGPVPAANAWALLTPIEQATLQPLQAQWPRLDRAAKAHWIAIADRLHGRPSFAVARAARRMAAWQQLSPAERAQARLHYRLAERLTPAERERRWVAYQASVHAARPLRDASGRESTAAAPAAAGVEQPVPTALAPEVRAGVPSGLRVRAVRSDAPASPARSGDAS
jgi:hypothetical protein